MPIGHHSYQGCIAQDISHGQATSLTNMVCLPILPQNGKVFFAPWLMAEPFAKR
jgi:hypothetical protein